MMKNRKEISSLLLFSLFIGVSYPAAAVATESTNPFFVVAVMYLIGLLVALVIGRRFTFRKADVLPSVAFAIATFLLLASLYNSLLFIPGPLASFLNQLGFLVAAFLEWAFFGQKIGRGMLTAFVVAAAGLIIILFSNGISLEANPGFLLGVALGVAGAVALGVQYIVGSRFSNRVNPMVSTLYSCVIISTASFMMFRLQAPSAPVSIPLQALPYVLYLGIFASSLSRYLQFYGQRKISATMTGVIFLSIPVVSLLSGLFFNQTLNALQMVGSLLLLFAVVVVVREQRHRR